MTKHLTYVGQTPAEGTGSPVIILRHLRRLAADGWKITIIAEHGQDTSACERAGWSVRKLPLRRRWWPPFRPESQVLRRLRTILLGRECRKLSVPVPDAILGYLAAHADFSPEIAAHFARQCGAPFTLLVHDDAAAFAKTAAEKRQLRARHAWIIRQTHQCWFVSPELAAEYDVPNEKRDVLLPMPEGWTAPVATPPGDGSYPRIYYAGFVWPPQYRLFAEIADAIERGGGRLVLVTRDTPELRNFLERAPVDWKPLFPSNREALAYLAGHASGLLVSYTHTNEEMPWVATSYPSKFVEYSHLGLPIALVAPPRSALANWAGRSSYPHYFRPDQLEALTRWTSDLRDAARWKEIAQASRRLATGEFSPEAIQAAFASRLLRQP